MNEVDEDAEIERGEENKQKLKMWSAEIMMVRAANKGP